MSSLSPLTIAVLLCLIASGGYLAARTARWVFEQFPNTFRPHAPSHPESTEFNLGSLVEDETLIKKVLKIFTPILPNQTPPTPRLVRFITSDKNTNHIQMHLENQEILNFDFSFEDIQDASPTQMKELFRIIVSHGISNKEAMMIMKHITSTSFKTKNPSSEDRALKASQIA